MIYVTHFGVTLTLLLEPFNYTKNSLVTVIIIQVPCQTKSNTAQRCI